MNFHVLRNPQSNILHVKNKLNAIELKWMEIDILAN